MTPDLLSVSHSNNLLHSHSSLPLTDYSVCFVSVLSQRRTKLTVHRSGRHSVRRSHSILNSVAYGQIRALRNANGNSQDGNTPSPCLAIAPKSLEPRPRHTCNASL